MRFLRPGFLLLLAATTVSALVACSGEEGPKASSDESEVKDREDLFTKSTTLDMRINAPFTTLFERYKTRAADPPVPDAKPGEAEFSEAAEVTLADADGKGTTKSFNARVFIRGESSKGDCPFPKLKIEFADKEALKGTLLKGHSKIRLNTHCGPGDESARSRMGRIQNGIGPVREDVIYRLIRAADVPTYLTRVTKVSYVDPAAATIDTFGMIMESGDDAAQRFAEEKIIEADGEYLDPSTARGKTTPDNDAKIIVTEALAGNRDFWVGGTHNLDSFGKPGAATMFKIPEDFDLCAITTANAPNWTGPVENASQGLKTEGIAAHFAKQKASMEAALDKAEKEGIASKALPSTDGKTTTDPGFKVARERLAKLFQLPELVNVAPGPTPDAGADAAKD